MNRTAFVLIALLGAVLLTLTTAQAAVPSLPTGAGGADIAQYMPKDSTFLVTINVGKLAETDLLDVIKNMGGNEAFAELEALGIDPAKDIKQFMVGVVVDRENPDNDPGVYMALSGNFPPAAKFVEAYKAEQEDDPETRQEGGKTIYTMDEVDWCFLEGVVLLVPLESGDADIAKMLGGAQNSAMTNADLLPLIKNVNAKATVWAVASLPEELRKALAENADEAPFDVSTLQTLTAAFDYDKNVALDVALGFTGEEGPKGFVEFWTAQVQPMAEAMGQQIPAIADLIGACEVKASGKTVTFKLKMAQEDFDTAIESMVQMMSGGMMGGDVEETDDEDMEW